MPYLLSGKLSNELRIQRLPLIESNHPALNTDDVNLTSAWQLIEGPSEASLLSTDCDEGSSLHSGLKALNNFIKELINIQYRMNSIEIRKKKYLEKSYKNFKEKTYNNIK